MNKEYTYIDEKIVLVKDENGIQKPIEYYDNLDEILVQENLIETIEDKISSLEEKSEDYKKYNKKHYIPIMLPMSILATTIGVPAIAYWISNGNTNMYTSSVNTIFGTINEAVFYGCASCIGFLPCTLLIEHGIYREYKNSIKIEKGINSELEFLKQQIVIEKQKLFKLQSEKIKNNTNNRFESVEVNDLEKLRILKNWLNLYYDLGYNEKKYYKYYLQGKLDNKLDKLYNNTEIQIAKKHLEEKGPILVKKTK